MIGKNSSASNNSVVVTGTGSTWSNYDKLNIGFQGSGNSLTISNSGQVISSGGSIGYQGNSSGNSVLVTGTNSLWKSSEALTIGAAVRSNTLTISNGGTVISDGCVLGLYYAGNNSAIVTGSGSMWSNSQYIYIGENGSGNSLISLGSA